MRIPLELLPPPAHSPARSSSAKQASIASRSPSARPLRESSEYRSHDPSSPAPPLGRSQEEEEKKKKEKKKFGFAGVTPEPNGGWGVSRKRPGPGGGVGGGRSREERCPGRGDTGGGGARKAGPGREGSCGWEGDAEGDDDQIEKGAVAATGPTDGIIVGEKSAGRRVRQREMLDLWWLTGE